MRGILREPGDVEWLSIITGITDSAVIHED
jgi:hypothetical protein